MNYRELDFGREELATVMLSYYSDLIAFVSTPAFVQVYKELMNLAPRNRPTFVIDVLLNHDELGRRGVTVPEGILIQTSAFGDRRPTTFVVKKFLPEKYHGAWENVNLTFFNEFNDDEISRDPAMAWRSPLPVALQNVLIARGENMDEVPAGFGIKSGSKIIPETTRTDDSEA